MRGQQFTLAGLAVPGGRRPGGTGGLVTSVLLHLS